MPLEWEQFALVYVYFIGNEMSPVDTVASYISKFSASHCVPEQGTRKSKEWKQLHKEDYFLTTIHHQHHQTEEDETSGTRR